MLHRATPVPVETVRMACARARYQTGSKRLFSVDPKSVIPKPGAGLETLNFSPPAELDSASQLATEVITLLNEAKTGPDFHVYAGSQ
jgi:hypothetical protein